MIFVLFCQYYNTCVFSFIQYRFLKMFLFYFFFYRHQFPAGEIPLLALPALAAGNAVIVKPSEVTPLTGALLTNAIAKALPVGTLQLLQGDGVVGEQLVSSPDVHMVAMTGSSATGKKIMEKCAKTLKRVVLELGGKDPMVRRHYCLISLFLRYSFRSDTIRAPDVCNKSMYVIDCVC